jgi:small-conductance mechanosensitive channel
MKHFIINSFRSMVYVAYFVLIAYMVLFAWTNRELLTTEFALIPAAAGPVSIAIGLFGGWVVATLVCGLIMTLLDIRDDLNDRLPDARED